MAKINKDEYEILKSLDSEWKWIARDKNGQLYKFLDKPRKINEFYWNDLAETWLRMNDYNFQFIQWEDSEPYSIAELIAEYEKDYKGSWEHAIEFSGEVFGESEKTEVKKDKLKRQAEGAFRRFGNNDLNPYELRIRILELIDQLDEPEVLSSDWIDGNKKLGHFQSGDGIYFGYFVKADKLQNLLVPKQELPVIPKYIADWIEGYNRKLAKWKLPSTFRSDVKYKADQRLYEWANKKGNMNIFMKAILLGYEVEEEQKYFVEDNEFALLCKGESEDGWKVISTHELKRDESPFEILDFKLTEQEIKDYDERYWAFRKPVEELE